MRTLDRGRWLGACVAALVLLATLSLYAQQPDGARPSKAAVPRVQWTFQPPADPPVPTVEAKDWPRNAVDRFVLAKLETRGLTPVGDADKRTLIRRATFDLLGLPPTRR